MNIKNNLFVNKKEPDPEGFFVVTPNGKESPLSADLATWLHQGIKGFLKGIEVKVNIEDTLYSLREIKVFFYKDGRKVPLW